MYEMLSGHLPFDADGPSVIPAFRPTPLQNRGRNFVRSKRRSTYTKLSSPSSLAAFTERHPAGVVVSNPTDRNVNEMTPIYITISL